MNHTQEYEHLLQEITHVFTNDDYRVCDVYEPILLPKKLIVMSDDSDNEPMGFGHPIDTLILVNMNLLDAYIPETKVLVLINCQRAHFASSYEEDPFYSCAPTHELVCINTHLTGQKIKPHLRLYTDQEIEFEHHNLISLDECQEYEAILKLMKYDL